MVMAPLSDKQFPEHHLGPLAPGTYIPASEYEDPWKVANDKRLSYSGVLDVFRSSDGEGETSAPHPQGVLWSENVGSGLRNDPYNRQRRRQLSEELVGHEWGEWGPEDELPEHIFNSSIPLQHLDRLAGKAVTVKEGPLVNRQALGEYDAPKREVRVRPSADADTVVHELGHAMHLVDEATHKRSFDPAWGVGNRSGPHPVEEAIADAYADRYTYHKEASEQRAEDERGAAGTDKGFREMISHTGYRPAYWHDTEDQAAYLATRAVGRYTNAMPHPHAYDFIGKGRPVVDPTVFPSYTAAALADAGQHPIGRHALEWLNEIADTDRFTDIADQSYQQREFARGRWVGPAPTSPTQVGYQPKLPGME